MQDTVIKGTGNSRSLKGPPNLLTMYPTWEAAAQAMMDGTFPIDIGPLNEAGVQTQGTALTKANLLTDALCSALGLANTATPTEAMDKLRQLVSTAQNTANGNVKSTYGTYTGNGSATKSLTFPFAPKLVIIGSAYELNDKHGALVPGKPGSWENSFIWYYGCDMVHVSRNYDYSGPAWFTQTGQTLSWESKDSTHGYALALNVTNEPYKYIAFG